MALVSLHQVHLSYGHPPLLDGVALQVDRGERVALVGRNGSGKSTLMKLIAGDVPPDSGEIARAQGLRVTRLGQEVPGGTEGTVFDVVSQGLGEVRPLLREYHRALEALGQGGEASMETLERAQARLEAADGWTVEQRVEVVLTRLGLDPVLPFASLSGGMKRRVMLAQALVPEPDLLLLDEPTNHLDVDSIAWLEGFLASSPAALLFVTHDRVFLQAVATRIVEVDRGGVISFPGDHATYLARREERLEVEARENALHDKRLAKEEAWLRRGVKARRARNEGRRRALEQLRRQRDQRRQRAGNVKLKLQEARRSGDLVLRAEGIAKAYDGRALIQGFSTTIQRGDRVGVIGPNGCGKSTLLAMLLGDLAPDAGEVHQGTALEVAHFDQMRSLLDEERSVAENVCPDGETVTVDGVECHVVGYLRDFLFPPERARTPVKALSGGERGRLLLARLFARPANLLVMDEPTNDLDAETLELLEERLIAYRGTLLLVSHDRAFLDNVVTSCIVFDQGAVREYVGGYSDWRRQRAVEQAAVTAATPAPPKAAAPKARAAGKLLNKERQLLEELPGRIEAREATQAALQAKMLEPDFYQQSPEEISRFHAHLRQLAEANERDYQLWAELEARR